MEEKVLPSPGSELVTMIRLLTAARVWGSRTFCNRRRLMPRNSLEIAEVMLSGVISPFWRRARKSRRTVLAGGGAAGCSGVRDTGATGACAVAAGPMADTPRGIGWTGAGAGSRAVTDGAPPF